MSSRAPNNFQPNFLNGPNALATVKMKMESILESIWVLGKSKLKLAIEFDAVSISGRIPVLSTISLKCWQIDFQQHGRAGQHGVIVNQVPQPEKELVWILMPQIILKTTAARIILNLPHVAMTLVPHKLQSSDLWPQLTSNKPIRIWREVRYLLTNKISTLTIWFCSEPT